MNIRLKTLNAYKESGRQSNLNSHFYPESFARMQQFQAVLEQSVVCAETIDLYRSC